MIKLNKERDNIMENDYITYGLVKITNGKYKGRFAYYDDDDTDDNDQEKAIIYFGSIVYNSNYFLINPDYLTQDYTFKDLKDRQTEIVHHLWKDISTKERVSLIEEKNLIDIEINSRYEDYIVSQKLSNKKVFLSHSSFDKEIVVSVALDLKEKGIDTWLDAFDILPGESIIDKINIGLNECDYILVFISKNSNASNWVKKEWETILWDEINSNKVKVIPIKLDDSEVPKILQTKKYIDFSKDYRIGIYELISALERHK